MSPIDLLQINVNAHTEKKNGLTYLSWAWAWAEALKADPQATFQVHLFNDMPYMDVNGTGMVWITVTMFGQPRTCMLPVMNHRNQPILTPDAFQVNTAIMRCMTKALALHGLGLYIYSGEDVPEEIGKEPVAKETTAVVSVATQTATADVEIKVKKEKSDPMNDAEADLFANGMIKFLGHCQDDSGLKSYWKANQAQLDKLKVSHPELYAKVRDSFSEEKKLYAEKAKEKTNE